MVNGRLYRGTFLGFNPDVLYVSYEQIPDVRTPISMKNITTLANDDGDVFQSSTLDQLIKSGRIPQYSKIIVAQEDGKLELEASQITHVSWKRNYAYYSFVGLAIDAIVVAILVDRASEPRVVQQPNPEGSCPFVYSFNGEEYILDSESFSGSIFKALQRTDWDNLDYLKEVSGKYIIRIQNELQETQYIDEVKLLVVDHPEGTRVAPTFSGTIYSLSALQPPRSATDLYQNNVADLIERSNDKYWISNPFGRNPADVEQVRDGLLIEFDRPPNTDFVNLLLSVQNTEWAIYLENQFLKLQGEHLDDWYTLMNTSIEARNSFMDFVRREGTLTIESWNGEEWLNAGSVWFVGPYVAKEQVVRLDISTLPEEYLRLRISSTAGLWKINSVLASYEPDTPFQITEIAPADARDQEGRDLFDLLGTIDDHYYIMQTTRDRAELIFTAPAPKESGNRSLILKSTGYYTVNMVPEGPGQPALITRFSQEPGSFGQYTLQLLNSHVTAYLEHSRE